MSSATTIAGSIGDHCIQGVKHEGTPVGRIEKIAGVQTYISDAKGTTDGPAKVLFYFADVYGPFYVNAQLVQDYFASHGFHVLGLDYFFGDPISGHRGHPDFDQEAWLKKYREKAAEATPGWIKAVREIYGEGAIYSAVGYCFGAPFVMDIAATDQVVASAFAHPAFLEEDHFKNLKRPLLLSCAEIDHTFPSDKRHRAEDILAEIKATYHVQLFSGVAHGWALRADLADENARWAKEESARSIIEWFKRFSVSK
ncbi:hypothetical protein D9619_003749 [Psilocybe cf. subviscida]|uniref:Dienelactone hydrolase domain-containing protein n=1 Tax=Psilocybe cf. subviscida TaxID=2480587 RepID=A0A8H5AYU8_9AGAR|nr:hypothetical protein D9619_003749 [Psilocybe cf. subviscida]